MATNLIIPHWFIVLFAVNTIIAACINSISLIRFVVHECRLWIAAYQECIDGMAVATSMTFVATFAPDELKENPDGEHGGGK